MNGIGKAGGILLILASVLGIVWSILFIILGGLWNNTGITGIANTVGIGFMIAGIIVMILSILMIVWSVQYIKSGRKKVLLGVFSIICAVLSLTMIVPFALYIVSAVFILLGKPEEIES